MPEPLLLDRFIPRYDHSVVYSHVFQGATGESFNSTPRSTANHPKCRNGSKTRSGTRCRGADLAFGLVSKPWNPWPACRLSLVVGISCAW